MNEKKFKFTIQLKGIDAICDTIEIVIETLAVLKYSKKIRSKILNNLQTITSNWHDSKGMAMLYRVDSTTVYIERISKN